MGDLWKDYLHSLQSEFPQSYESTDKVSIPDGDQTTLINLPTSETYPPRDQVRNIFFKGRQCGVSISLKCHLWCYEFWLTSQINCGVFLCSRDIITHLDKYPTSRSSWWLDWYWWRHAKLDLLLHCIFCGRGWLIWVVGLKFWLTLCPLIRYCKSAILQ